MRARTGNEQKEDEKSCEKESKSEIMCSSSEQIILEKSTEERLREGFVIKSPVRRRDSPKRNRKKPQLSLRSTSSNKSTHESFEPSEKNLSQARDSLLRTICDKSRDGLYENLFRNEENPSDVLKLNTFRGALRNLGIGASRALSKAMFQFLDKERKGT